MGHDHRLARQHGRIEAGLIAGMRTVDDHSQSVHFSDRRITVLGNTIVRTVVVGYRATAVRIVLVIGEVRRAQAEVIIFFDVREVFAKSIHALEVVKHAEPARFQRGVEISEKLYDFF